MTDPDIYEVGGCVRDDLLGIPTKDIDYTVVGLSSFTELEEWMTAEGFDIFVKTPDTLTIRAHFPKNNDRWLNAGGRDTRKLTADFVLARKEGGYTDGRHPDTVVVGTLEDDLSRRDFTVNALAKNIKTGEIIDLHGGMEDLRDRTLRCVGTARDRFTEDALRALRAIRFGITKGFQVDYDILDALDSAWLPPLVDRISIERVQDELEKCFRADTKRTITVLSRLYPVLQDAIFRDGLWLLPTLKSFGKVKA